MDRLDMSGRRNLASFLPQYLIKAILVWARAVLLICFTFLYCVILFLIIFGQKLNLFNPVVTDFCLASLGNLFARSSILAKGDDDSAQAAARQLAA